MCKLAIYHLGAVLVLLFTQTAHAVKFDIKKGFVYEEQEVEAQKQAEIEKKLSQPYVKVLRLFNEDNKISDPILEAEDQQAEEIQFLTLDDKTIDKPIDQPEGVREIATLSGAVGGSMDWLLIEKNLLELEAQFGIRSMPVVEFTKPENLDKNAFAERVAYLEDKLGLEPENLQITSIPERLITIKQKLSVETETVSMDIDLNL